MKNFTELYEGIKKVDVVQRKKMARRMSKMAKSATFQRKKEKARLKMRSPEKIKAAARKAVIKQFRYKMFPNYDQIPLAQSPKADEKVNQKFGKKIDKLTNKMVQNLKKKELERVKQARAAKAGKIEDA